MVNNKKDDSTQERILAAAKRVFLLNGMAGARMQDIADEAGINKAMLHYYFRSKDVLFEMIFREALDKLFPQFEGIADADGSFFEKIEKFCALYIDLIAVNPYIPLFVLNEVNKDPQRFKERFWENKDTVLKKFIAQIEREIREGKIRPVNPAHLFINMLSMCIFPFIAKPIWMMTTGVNDEQFAAFMQQRKQEIPAFIIASIKK